MHILPFYFLVAILCVGCNSANENQQANSEQKEIKTFTHVITTETEYYTTGPQQSRPPDGKFPAGTRVSIVEEAGSYVLAHSEGGVEAYIAADVVKKQENTAMDVSGIVKGSNKFALDLFMGRIQNPLK